MAKKEVTTPAVEKTKKIVDHYFDVIVSPILTEKTMNLTLMQNLLKKKSKMHLKQSLESK